MTIISFVAGFVAGGFYFGGLWWNTRLFAEGGSTRTMILVMIARFVLLGGLLTLASLQGAMPLLAMTLGIFIARLAMLRRVRAA